MFNFANISFSDLKIRFYKYWLQLPLYPAEEVNLQQTKPLTQTETGFW